MIAIQLEGPKPLTQHPESLGCPGTEGTAKQFSHLCFSLEAECFWAAVGADGSVLHRLAPDFQELQCLRVPDMRGQKLCGISCDCSGLWLLTANSVLHVEPECGTCQRFLSFGLERKNVGILGLCGGRAVSYMEGCRTFVEVICPDCEGRAEVCIPKGYCLDAMVLLCVRCDRVTACTTYEIRLLLSKPCGAECACLDCHVCCREDCCPEQSCHPPHNCCSCAPQWEILQAIALEETENAHILNAEGEKLREAVARCECPEDLLCANESAWRTIVQITQLEGQLISKLEALSDQCPLCKCCE